MHIRANKNPRCLSTTFVHVFLFLFFCARIFAPDKTSAQSAVSKEYQIKAVFLFNFIQFIVWPENAFPDTNAPFAIGVLGDDPFGAALAETVQGETIRNRKIVIEHSKEIKDLKNCQLIFISKSESRQATEILASLGSAPALTVGDFENFARSGGVINFYLQEKKVRFEINPDAAQNRGIKISSQLLGLGKIVSTEMAK